MTARVLLCASLFLFVLTPVLFVDVSLAQAPLPDSTESDAPAVEVKEIVVSDTRLPSVEKNVYAVPSKITIITAEDIRNSGARTVQEAIQQATGIIMYDQVGNSFQQKIDLRGFSGDPVPTTSVFVDGVLINEPDFNTVNFDLIPFDTIERIEILPGPSAIYGKNALGGVVNIITKRGTAQRQATGEVLFGSFQRERYTVNTSGPVGPVNYYANFARELEDGYREQSDARISRFFGKLGYHPSKQTDISVSYTYVKNRLFQAGTLTLTEEAANRRFNRSPGDFVDNENNFVRVNGQQKLPLNFSLSVNAFYRRLGQRQFTNSGGGFTADGVRKTESRGGVLQVTHDTDIFRRSNVLVLGGEFTRNDIGTSSLDFGVRGLTSVDEDILALYVQDNLEVFPELLLNAGLRYDHDQIAFTDNLSPGANASKRFNRVNPRAGITYLIAPRSSVYFSYSEGFRTPTVDELFARLGSSNPGLKPVVSRNFELGLKTAWQQWASLELALYHSNVRDEIFFTCTVCIFGDPAFDGFNRNIDKSRRRGVEATLRARYNDLLDGVLNYTFTEAQFRTNTTISTGGTVSVVQVGDSIPLVPKNRFSATINYRPLPGLTLSLSGLYISSRFYLNDNGNTQPRLPGYIVMNSRIAYERKVPGGRLSAVFLLNNMFDARYFSYGIFSDFSGRNVMPALPLTAYGGLSYKFESFGF